MKILLDTHALLWWVTDDQSLSATVGAIIDDSTSEILVSAASAWEICTKHRLGKLPQAAVFSEQISTVIKRLQFKPLPISVEHGQLAGSLSGAHKDPFDRMLAAQSIIEDVPIATNDAAFLTMGCKVVW